MRAVHTRPVICPYRRERLSGVLVLIRRRVGVSRLFFLLSFSVEGGGGTATRVFRRYSVRRRWIFNLARVVGGAIGVTVISRLRLIVFFLSSRSC